MKPALLDAIAGSRAGYSELRVRRIWSTTILLRDGVVESAATAEETGGVARCCSPGTGWGIWGFIGSDRLRDRLLRAHELSLAGASRQPIVLAPIASREVENAGPLGDDPRGVPLDDKRRHAEALAALLFSADRRIAGGRVLCRDQVIETWLATSEGSWIHQLKPSVSVAILAVAEEAGSVERALGSFGLAGGWRGAVPAERMVRETAEAAVERLHAVPVRPGSYPVVLGPPAAGALIHRAIAHLARPALPGAEPDVLPKGTRVAPDCFTVGDDPAAEGLRASAPCDDEGTPSRRTVLVQNGVVLGHLHSRETAGATGDAPTGHARAGSLRGSPHPRATNSYLAAGQGSLDDLIAGMRRGVYIADALSCEAAGDLIGLHAGRARMIRDGKLAEPVKDVELGGELLDLLGAVDAVAGDFAWETGCGRCRDGAAGVVPVTTGAAHLLLRHVAVGEGLA